MDLKASSFLDKLPNIKKWLKHILTLPRMQQTSAKCGFKMADLERCLTSTSDRDFPVEFSILPVTLDVEEDNKEIGLVVQ